MGSRYDMVIFDLDGTLAHTLPDVSAGIIHAVTGMGYPAPSESLIQQAIGPGEEDFFRALFPEGAEPDRDEFFRVFRDHYGEHCLDTTMPYPGIPEFLRERASDLMAVATNKPGPFARKVLTGLDLITSFRTVISPLEVSRPKPSPDMILSLLREHGVPADRTLFVGDTAGDLTAGQKAGVDVCAAAWGYGGGRALEKYRPDYLIDDPSRLYDIAGNA